MKLNKFKFSFILILIIFLFFLFNSFVLAQERGLEIKYPKIGGIEITTSTTIAEYVAYIFQLSLIIAAVAAFAILIYGGFRYLTSAGNPLAMDDAKKWIFGGILGLVLLLSSWLILNLINPTYTKPRVNELKNVGGIYLIDKNNQEKRFYSVDTIREIPEDFKAVKIEFISYPPADPSYNDPNKEELVSIFYYKDINEGGDVKRIDNNKALNSPFASSSSPQSLDFPPRSLSFLWQKEGVYLYEEENLKTPPLPRFYKESQRTLKDFNDKAKSIRFVEEKPNPWRNPYWTILFKDTDYEGACGAYDSSQDATTEIKGSLKENVSSIALLQGTLPQGDVIFYDKLNCEGNEYPWQPKGLIFRYDSVSLKDDTKDLDQWLSMKINGNFSVLLITEYHSGLLSYLGERCMLFSGIGCIPSFKGTSIYSADPESFRPKQAYIFPTIE